MSTRANHWLQAVQLARDCHALGARTRTIHHVTGLPPREVNRLFFADPKTTPRGRAPDSPEWYHGANLLYRAKASMFISLYRRLRDGGFAAGETLVGAYRQLMTICHCTRRISFDRAFDLAAHTDGIWLAKTASFSVTICPTCGREFLAASGAVALTNDDCPFCKLVQRYPSDQRVQSSFPTQALDAVASQLRAMALVCPEHARLLAGLESPVK